MLRDVSSQPEDIFGLEGVVSMFKVTGSVGGIGGYDAVTFQSPHFFNHITFLIMIIIMTYLVWVDT